MSSVPTCRGSACGSVEGIPPPPLNQAPTVAGESLLLILLVSLYPPIESIIQYGPPMYRDETRFYKHRFGHLAFVIPNLPRQPLGSWIFVRSTSLRVTQRSAVQVPDA